MKTPTVEEKRILSEHVLCSLFFGIKRVDVQNNRSKHVRKVLAAQSCDSFYPEHRYLSFSSESLLKRTNTSCCVNPILPSLWLFPCTLLSFICLSSLPIHTSTSPHLNALPPLALPSLAQIFKRRQIQLQTHWQLPSLTPLRFALVSAEQS